jgi:hypothetical protein
LALVPVGKKRHAKKEGHRKRERKREGGSEGAREGTKNTRGPCLPCGTITFLHNLPIAQKKTQRVFDTETVLHKDPFTQHRAPLQNDAQTSPVVLTRIAHSHNNIDTTIRSKKFNEVKK